MDVPTQICAVVDSTDGVNGRVTVSPSTTKKERTENSSESNSSSNSSNENSEEGQGHLNKEVEEIPVFQYPDAGKRRNIGGQR